MHCWYELPAASGTHVRPASWEVVVLSLHGKDDPVFSVVFDGSNDGIDGVLALAALWPVFGLRVAMRGWRICCVHCWYELSAASGTHVRPASWEVLVLLLHGKHDPDYSVVFGGINDGINGVLAPTAWWPVLGLRCDAQLEAGL